MSVLFTTLFFKTFFERPWLDAAVLIKFFQFRREANKKRAKRCELIFETSAVSKRSN